MHNGHYDNGTIGTMNGVKLMEGGKTIHIDVPYYCNNAFGIEATLSQIVINEEFELGMITSKTATSTPDSQGEDWYRRLVDDNNSKPALIKMINIKSGKIANICRARLKKVDDKNYTLILTNADR